MLRDRAGGLATRDHEAARLGVRVPGEIRFRIDAVGDEAANEWLPQEGVVILGLRDDRILDDGPPDGDPAH